MPLRRHQFCLLNPARAIGLVHPRLPVFLLPRARCIEHVRPRRIHTLQHERCGQAATIPLRTQDGRLSSLPGLWRLHWRDHKNRQWKPGYCQHACVDCSTGGHRGRRSHSLRWRGYRQARGTTRGSLDAGGSTLTLQTSSQTASITSVRPASRNLGGVLSRQCFSLMHWISPQ